MAEITNTHEPANGVYGMLTAGNFKPKKILLNEFVKISNKNHILTMKKCNIPYPNHKHHLQKHNQ